MVGQIRSYISYIGVDSDQSYLDRIRKMIDDVPSDTDKATLLLEYTNKVNQIDIMKRYIAEKNAAMAETPAPVDTVPEPEEDEPLVKVKTFEEEMEEKIKEYQQYQEEVEEKHEKEEENLPDIYTNAYNLIRMFNEDLKVLNGLPVSQKVNKTMVRNLARTVPRTIPRTVPKNSFIKIPTLPIIED